MTQCLKWLEKNEAQKVELEAMRKKAEEERKQREKEIKEMKQKEFDENIAKYNKIANSEFGQDMKVTAWNSVLKNLGLAQGSVAVGDENALRLKLKLDLPLILTDKRDGKVYKLVEIGDQVWMAENLAYKPNSGTYWTYDNDQSNLAKYGYLYDWETAKDVCPDGYHLPTDDEWKELETELGMTQADANEIGWRGSIGEQLKSETGWSSNGNGTNESGFNAFAGGYRYTDGSFYYVGNYGYWWSATPYGSSNAWCRRLDYDSAKVGRYNDIRAYGFSGRCLRN